MCPRCSGRSQWTVTASASPNAQCHCHPHKRPNLGHKLHGCSTDKALALVPAPSAFTMGRQSAVPRPHRRGAGAAFEPAVFPTALSGLGPLLLLEAPQGPRPSWGGDGGVCSRPLHPTDPMQLLRGKAEHGGLGIRWVWV